MIVNTHDVISATLEIVNKLMATTASNIDYMCDSLTISNISCLPENIWLPNHVIALSIFVNDVNGTRLAFGGEITLRRCKVQTDRWKNVLWRGD